MLEQRLRSADWAFKNPLHKRCLLPAKNNNNTAAGV